MNSAGTGRKRQTRNTSDARVPGSSPLTAEGYVERYAGNSFKFSRYVGEPINREIYYGKDGSFYTVDLDMESIQYGTWTVNAALGAHLVLKYTSAGIADGKPYRSGISPTTLYTFALPDGTASTFSRAPDGAYVNKEPKLTPGFQSRSRFNAIKRKVDAALGS